MRQNKTRKSKRNSSRKLRNRRKRIGQMICMIVISAICIIGGAYGWHAMSSTPKFEEENTKNLDLNTQYIVYERKCEPNLAKVTQKIVKKSIKDAREKQKKKEDPAKYNKKFLKTKAKWKTAYTTDVINVRSKPSTKKGKILGRLPWNSKVKYTKHNDEWVVVKYKKKFAYVSKKYLSKKGVKSVTMDTVYEHQKSWMDYRTITDTSSPQYKIEHTDAYTGNYGIRMVDGRYLCAVGSAYSHDVGRYVDLILEDGTIIPCILGDQKDDGDTDPSNMYTEHDGSVAEFVVDTEAVPSKVKKSGNFCSIPQWKSSIKEIRIYFYNPYNEI